MEFVSNITYFDEKVVAIILINNYFAETTMGVDVHAQEIETEYTTTIHRSEKSRVTLFC